MSPIADTLGGVGYVLFWGLFALALALVGERSYRLAALLRLAAPEKRFDQLGRRLGGMLARFFLQICTLRSLSLKDRAGIGHVLIFAGFLIMVPGYILYVFIGEGLGLASPILSHPLSPYFSGLRDLAALGALGAFLWALLRRGIAKPKRLEKDPEEGLILTLLSLLMVSHFLTWGFYLSVAQPEWRGWLPVSSALSGLFTPIADGVGGGLFQASWWLQFLLIIFFLAHARFSGRLHIFGAPFNLFFRSLEPKGALIPIMDLEKAEHFGVGRVEDFTWKQHLDGYACTHCGRCFSNCPAWNSGKPLHPKKLVLDIRDQLFKVGGKSGQRPDLISQVITEEVLWECTTCRACQEECPVLIEHIQKIIDMRRHLVLERGQVPASAESALRSLEARGHPWRGTTATRTAWATGLGVPLLSATPTAELLYWVGCTSALEERSQKVPRALVRLLGEGGVSFAILGEEESCCGEPARRLGNEYLFQLQARRNIETFQRYGVKRILASCPHCFNTFKNEYPQWGGQFEVLHHSQLLHSLVARGSLQLRGMAQAITYHDSCYLGRYNGIYHQPRRLLSALSGARVVEMGRRWQKGFCCGGGGGRMWLEETVGQRINRLRTREALATGAGIAATACPYCLQMFDDGIKAEGAEEKLKVMDIAEVLAAALPPR